MPLQDVISCAPFRLPAPRPLTAYEWNIVGTRIARSLPFTDANALVVALQNQPCVEWKTSAFGPAPAVSTAQYEGLGRWYASLNAPSRTNALAAIAQGALCKPGPWQQFYPQQPTWEGDAQNPDNSASSGVPGLEACAAERQRTAYVPVTGQDMVNVAKLVLIAQPQLAGQIPQPFLGMIQNGQLPPDFLKLSFLLGIEFPKPGETTKAPFCSEAALIWAPGQGASVLSLFGPNGINLPALISLLTAMAPTIMPTLLPSLLPGLGAQFPGLLQQILTLPQTMPGALPQVQQSLPGILSAATQVFGAAMQGSSGGQPWVLPSKLSLAGLEAGGVSPQTPPTTGVPIVDGVPSDVTSSEGVMWGLAVAGVAVAIGLLLLVGRGHD